MNAYDRLLAAIGDDWWPSIYCTVPGRDWDPETIERDTVVVEVRAPGRWARVPVPEDMIRDDPDDTAWAVKVEATHTWETLARTGGDGLR